jgi:hypothetical protein
MRGTTDRDATMQAFIKPLSALGRNGGRADSWVSLAGGDSLTLNPACAAAHRGRAHELPAVEPRRRAPRRAGRPALPPPASCRMPAPNQRPPCLFCLASPTSRSAQRPRLNAACTPTR